MLMGASGDYRITVASQADVGQTVTQNVESSSKQVVTVLDLAGKLVGTKTHTLLEREEWTDTTVRRDGDHATFRTECRKGEVKEDGRQEPSSFNGKRFTVTVRGEQVGIMASDGRPLDDAKLKSLQDQTRRTLRAEQKNLCVPRDPLSVGATWKLSLEQIDDCFGGLGSSAGTGSGSAVLKSVENGFATVDFRFSEGINNMGPLIFDAPVQVDGTGQLRVSLSDPLSWTRTITVHLTGKAHPRGPSEPSLVTDLHLTEVTRSSR
jgi:hypothetical protein